MGGRSKPSEIIIMVEILKIVHSGTKKWAHAIGDERELRRLAERLRVEVKADARGLHLDLSEHQRKLALRYGAKEQ